MRIGELAKQSGCDTETIRFYEREGLLSSPLRETNGYRNYTESHLVQLNFIRHCRSLGIGLPDVRILRSFQASPELACDGINELIEQQIEVRRGILAVARPVRGEDAGSAPQHVDADAGVVGERGEPGVGMRGARLDEGVLGEGHAVFDRLGAVVADHLEVGPRARDDLAELLNLVRVVRRQNNPRHHRMSHFLLSVSHFSRWMSQNLLSNTPRNSRNRDIRCPCVIRMRCARGSKNHPQHVPKTAVTLPR